ncbi:hypothetical protein BuS5_03499 [Desulfosarcina sp. BuS5]|uniref:hypothetical protein n=1 Tax=Desulfosarcina sp. BuS5 TaxID=933262 RepID=UPI00047F411C|nr:hypothetical protein [Desulfosarcina sp. BuS5]WDN90528.1 hypothetical protein BuS5_03499 [Desulfosarcina sp. BuS5]
MTSLAFDTFENVKRLKAVGFTEEQAAEQTKIIAELVEERLVTRQYLDERLAVLEADVTSKIIKWVAGMLVVQAAIVATLVKLL